MSDVGIIPIDRGQASGFDELTGASPSFVNLLVAGAPGAESARAICARPGIRAWSGFPATSPSTSPVVAMTTLGDHLLYITDDGAGTRNVYSLYAGAILDLSGGIATQQIEGVGPVRLVPWRQTAYACGGGAIQILTGGTSARLGGASPDASDVCVLSQRLMAVVRGDLGVFQWSDLGEAGASSWDLFDFQEAEARPDALIACSTTTRRLWMFGAETLQVYAPDPDSTWAPETAIEVGCAAARSIIRSDQVMTWLDERRRIVQSAGSDVQVLSGAGIAATLDGLTAVSDCWGFRAKMGAFDLLVWVFPTAGVTYAWDTVSQTWSEWRRFEAATLTWKPWAPTSYLYAFGKHLVGMPDGSIAELSLEAHSDLTDPLAWVLRTGFREVEKRRHTFDARFVCRRGETADTTATIGVRWRDDTGAFTPRIDLPLGPLGDYEANVVVSPAGMPYRRRQWELSGSADVAYLIAGAKETYEEAEG